MLSLGRHKSPARRNLEPWDRNALQRVPSRLHAMPSNKKLRINGHDARHSMLAARSPFHCLYAKPLPAARTGPLFNAFSYPTKISPEAIALFIATHTNPGDTVLDVFAGSGTTGLAALLCDKPSDELKDLARQIGAKPIWGPRKAVLYELGTLGAFISRTMCNPPDPLAFEAAAKKFVAAAQEAIGHVYEVRDARGDLGELRHAIWSDVLICPSCRKEVLFSQVGVTKNPLRFAEKFKCPSCKHSAPTESVKRVTETVFDPLIRRRITRKKRRLAMVYGRTNGKRWQRAASPDDASRLDEIDRLPIPQTVPVIEMAWGDLKRNGYHTGISHVHHFYTRRNLLVLGTLWKAISQYPEEMRDALRLLVLSYNSTHSTLMTRVVVKDGNKNFVLTGAQSGVLYISSLPVEKNIFEGLRRKIKTFSDAFALIRGSKSEVTVVNGSSTSLRLDHNSVDYVFTDPPFGDYIPYAELNQVNEIWLGQRTERRQEIIISNSQEKRTADYARLMATVFEEAARVLKPSGRMTVVFHSAKASVWKALTDAYTHAGFSVSHGNILDKLQASFKQVVSNVAVKGDPLLLLTKYASALKLKRRQSDTESIVRQILASAQDTGLDDSERTAERLYSRYVLYCLEQGAPVSMNAEAFYHRVRALPRTR